MPASNTRIQSNDGRSYDWIVMTDFTAGIQQQSNNPNSAGGVVVTTPDKPTACLTNNGVDLLTVGCYGLPSGGISGLPRAQDGNAAIDTTYETVPNGNLIEIDGMVAIDPGQGTPAGATTSPNATIAYVIAYMSSAPAPWNELIFVSAPNSPDSIKQNDMTGQSVNLMAPFRIAPTFPFICYILDSGTVYPTVGYSSNDGQSTSGHNTFGCWLYESDGTQTLIGSGRNGYYFSHQGRVVLVESNSDSFTTGSIALFQISFTDPPESTTLGTQYEIFMTNIYDAITAFGSLSSSELLLLTGSNGGIVVSNDIANPYITAVPGVQGTGSMFGKANVSPLGLVYLSSDSGAWVWNGGQSATRISTQLAPSFWEFGNYWGTVYFSCQNYGDWIAFTGNWIFDTVGNGWWMLNDPTILDSINYYNCHYALGNFNGHQALYAMPGVIRKGDANAMVVYDQSYVNTNWLWTSNYVQVAYGQLVDIRELVFTVTNVSDGEVEILPSIMKPNGSQVSLDPIIVGTNPQPLEYRRPCYVQTDLFQLQLSIESLTNTNGAGFVINSIAVGYETRFHLAAV